jgi:Surface glycan-binding protein B xyloglucan binding domain
MKTSHKLLSILFLILGISVLISSCDKDDQIGEPSIDYVRVTRPESSDSLLVGAGQGRLIAIIGKNLQTATEIWFNDQKANLTPTYITNKSILVAVPTPIPLKITNTLTIKFKNGKELIHNFEVEISKPYIAGMVSEYVNTGDVATIRGDFFYEPLTVTFAGGVTGQLETVEDRLIKVRVPSGALPGQITIKTNFGETKSDFWFRDNRNVFLSSDPFTGWWNASYVVTNPAPGDPVAISGNYIRVKKPIGAWAWTEVAGGPASAMGEISKNVPDAAILKPDDYFLKFEVNTLKPYTSNLLKINVALNAEDNNAYQWKPPFDTQGQWQTVSIPFEEIVASYAVKPTVNPNGYWTRLLFHGPGDLDADISFDNFRVVPKFSK